MARFEWTNKGPLARSGMRDAALISAGPVGWLALLGIRGADRYNARQDRRANTPFAPSPEVMAANSPDRTTDALGITNWRSPGSSASPSGQYGPMATGYAGLPQDPADPAATPQYDQNMTQNLVDGYQSVGLMGSRPLASMRGVTDGGTRGFGVQGTTDIGGTLAALNAFGNLTSGGSNGNYFEWLARHRPGPQF